MLIFTYILIDIYSPLHSIALKFLKTLWLLLQHYVAIVKNLGPVKQGVPHAVTFKNWKFYPSSVFVFSLLNEDIN
jgi:hypothetical protein